MTAAAVWSTEAVAPARAFDAWSEKMSELHLTWALTHPRREPFSALVRYRRLDNLTIADFRGGRFSGERSGGSRPAGGDQLIGILINLSGRLVCRYGGDDVVLGPDDMLVWDSELAIGFEAVEPHRELSLMLPRDQVPQTLSAVAAQTSLVTSVAPGAGLAAIAAAQLKAITGEIQTIPDAGIAIACQAFFDTLDAALSPVAQWPMSSMHAGLLARIRRYVEDNLDDPGLCASSIAAAHGISVRLLHLIFADTGTTVSRWVRSRRLTACYRDLARARRGMRVTDVAFRWGFSDAAHFSRLFKQAFGVTPSVVMGGKAAPDLTAAGP